MIIGNNRTTVIENIRNAAEEGDFYRKVELDDPVLTQKESREITEGYLANRKKPSFKLKSFAARQIANIGSSLLNRQTEIVGEEKLPDFKKGAIITSNHFGPLENTVIRYLVRKHGKKRLNIVSQVTNFAMTGVIGFLMNYADTVPLSDDFRYLAGDFLSVLKELLEKDEAVLIYPEQEMWFNYRKPRPPKRGAYHFAAKLNVPVISCFVEIIDTDEKDTDEFYKVKYRLHILDTLCPSSEKSAKENSIELCQKDYALKKEAYERIYSKPLHYRFEKNDIAGWIGHDV